MNFESLHAGKYAQKLILFSDFLNVCNGQLIKISFIIKIQFICLFLLFFLLHFLFFSFSFLISTKHNFFQFFFPTFNLYKFQFMDKVKQDYLKLLIKFEQEQKQVQNLNQLYCKFKNLKEYQQQYDRNQELKKQLQFWGKQSKSARQQELESNIAMMNQNLMIARQKLGRLHQVPVQPPRMNSLSLNNK